MGETTRSAVLSTLNLVAGPHEDPMTDDLTVPLAIELAKCRAIVCELVQCSPYPDFEDATGGCYFCGQHFGHDKACLYRRAEELINVQD